MARAQRHYLPGLIWHITHRCHKREFLLKLNRDKRAWLKWVLMARRLYGLCVLNFVITSNHVHLLVLDRDDRGGGAHGLIPRSLHLAEARVAQEYNTRKGRSGAFWEDRYHATAIETGEHLLNCLVYIDLNMVRAEVVDHPADWPFGGYHELQHPCRRFRNQLVDWRALGGLLGISDLQRLRDARREWVEGKRGAMALERDPKWTDSVAVGGKDYLERIAEELGRKAKGRGIQGGNGVFALREEGHAYLRVFGAKNEELR